MLSDFRGADRVYIACGYTDLRRGIDGLAELVRQQFQLDPFSNTLFLFCGRKRDRIKALYAYVNSIPKGKTILAQWHARRVIPAGVLRLCQIKITGANRVWTA